MPKIDKLFAFIIADKDENDEGVPAVQTPLGPMPLMGADTAKVDSLRRHAQMAADMSGKEVTLKVFDAPRTLEVLKPRKAKP